MGTFVIAEAGSSHDNDLQKAYRLIEAAKECGADAVKFQWTSNSYGMAVRRGLGQAAADMYGKYLQKPVSWLESLKAHADKVGIEFMCTVYLIEDIATIAPLVKRYKISAYESKWHEFVVAHSSAITSCNDLNTAYNVHSLGHQPLWCVSKYPTTIDELQLRYLCVEDSPFAGLSDHTANVLTGAAAVAAGAKIVEAHIRLWDTSPENPDYPHSLQVNEMRDGALWRTGGFNEYVHNIRTVERML